MKYGWIMAAAIIGTAVPCAAMAQNTSTNQQTTTADTSKARQNTVSTSTGDVAKADSGVTDAMRKEQKDANLIGSPAWWSTRATADGKPASTRSKP
jgi:hypothetical protein